VNHPPTPRDSVAPHPSTKKHRKKLEGTKSAVKKDMQKEEEKKQKQQKKKKKKTHDVERERKGSPPQ
jgi:hypothetical protein